MFLLEPKGAQFAQCSAPFRFSLPVSILLPKGPSAFACRLKGETMADPLSIAASIAGLITVADEVFLRLMKFAKSATDAGKEAKSWAAEINDVAGHLDRLLRTRTISPICKQNSNGHSPRNGSRS